MSAAPHHAIKESFLVGRALLNFTSAFVSIGVFLFGFEQGLMSSLLTNKYFKDYYKNPSPAAVGTMIAILEIGALFSSFVAGKVGDKIGRRRTIRHGSFIFVVGGLLQTTSVNIFNLGFGRLISGVAIGFLTTIIPCYQLEISPPDDRGFYACLEFTGNIIGYSTLIWVDYGFLFIEGNASWRLPLLVQCIVGFLLFLGSFVIVETPRWLLDHDHDHEGMIVIADMYADGDVEDEAAKLEFRSIKENVLIQRIEGGERSYTYMFQRYKKRLSVACFLQMFAQMNGINIISYYAPMIFELAGWVGRQAILMTGINSLIYLLSTFPPWYLVDGWGRKPLLLTGSVLMAIPLLVIAWLLEINNEYTPQIVVVSVFVFNAAFGTSWGPIPWMMNEVLPNSVRLKGAAALTATNWLFNFLVGEMTPILLDKIKWKTYLIPAGLCILSFLCVHYLFPETKGLSLEEMGSVFDDSSLIFLFHSGYGSTLDSNHRDRELTANVSISENDAFRQLPAQQARGQALHAGVPQDGIVTGQAPPGLPRKTSALEVNPIEHPMFHDNRNSGVEPPNYDSIIKFKIKQSSQPGVLKLFYQRLFGAKVTDEESTPLVN